jgi:hypothetical protein
MAGGCRGVFMARDKCPLGQTSCDLGHSRGIREYRWRLPRQAMAEPSAAVPAVVQFRHRKRCLGGLGAEQPVSAPESHALVSAHSRHLRREPLWMPAPASPTLHLRRRLRRRQNGTCGYRGLSSGHPLALWTVRRKSQLAPSPLPGA